MRALKLCCLLFLFLAASQKLFSQYYYYNDRRYDHDLLFELGASVGGMNCVTDVGGANSDKGYYLNEVKLKNTKLATGVYGGLIYKGILGLRVEAAWGQVAAFDSDITSTSTLNLVYKNNRNLSFRTSLNEITLMAEFHPTMLKYYEEGPPLWSPYIVGGIGRFNFNPQALYNGEWIAVRPLHTEGQGFAEYPDRKTYKLSQTNIPLGVGVKYELSAVFNLRFELLHRILFTDYLDDVSSSFYVDPNVFPKYLNPVEAKYAQYLSNPSKNGKIPPRRGNPKDKDTYMSATLKLGVVLGRNGR